MVDSAVRGGEIEMEFGGELPDGNGNNFQRAATQSMTPQQLYVHTEPTNKKYKRAGGTPTNAKFVTMYRVALSLEQIRANKEELNKCEVALKKYYEQHKYVQSCTVESSQSKGYFIMKMTVIMTDEVEKLLPIGEVSDRVELIEKMTVNLRDAQFD